MPDQTAAKKSDNALDSLGRLRSNLLDNLIRKLSNPVTARRNRFIMLAVTALLLTFIILPGRHFSYQKLKPGDIATSDIRATQDYLVDDHLLTEQRRKEAANSAPVIYNLNEHVPFLLAEKLQAASSVIETGKESGKKITSDEWRKILAPVLDTELTDAEIEAFLGINSWTPFLENAKEKLLQLYKRKIVLDTKVFETDYQRGIRILDSNGHPVDDRSADDVTEISQARSMVAGWSYPGVPGRNYSAKISSVIARTLLPNLFYNQEATETNRKSLMDAVRPVLFRIQKGETIVRTGERITQEQSEKLRTIFNEQKTSHRLVMAAGLFSLILVLFYFPYRFACGNIRKFNPSNRDIFVIFLLITGSFLVFKTAMQISNSIGSVFPSIDPNNYFYLFPFAATAMIVRVLINSEVALVFCSVTVALLGVMFGGDMQPLIYALLGSIIGAHGMRQCTDRNIIYMAGMKVSVVNLLLALSFQAFNDTLFTLQTWYAVIFAITGGLLNAVFVSGFIPVIESFFHYTTDIKLLELANLNSPLLRDLMVRAPGTYHHSVVVGNLVEAAAESINANPLLARVAAYYHDIGKASKPLYFIENQTGEENRHDRLTPSMSALILISHIKEGAELAREKHLGQPIIDIIRQHHGTGLIKFFYDRAKSQAEASGQSVDEKNFRYPGPKPQTREAGIVMLADCVEAASRTLHNPTPDRIQGMVQKMINNIFIDGQLDECELTLKNLHEIARSFNRILAGIFHHRVDYPEPVYKGVIPQKKTPLLQTKPEQGGDKVADTDKQQTEAAQDRVPPLEKGGIEDIKRLGMS